MSEASSKKVINSVALNDTIKGNTNTYRISNPHHFVSNNYGWDGVKLYRGNTLMDLSGSNPSASSEHGQNKTMAELGQQSTYEALGWDFENVWVMRDGLPRLRFMEEETQEGGVNDPDADANLVDTSHRSSATTSSGNGYTADKAVDGNASTRWESTANGGNPQTLTVLFNANYWVNHIHILQHLDLIESFTIEYLKPGTTDEWLALGSGTAVGDNAYIYCEKIAAKGIRINMNKPATSAISIAELEIKYTP